MQNNEDIKFMQRAIQLSLKGYGHVNPNPLVGAVLVKDGKIIDEFNGAQPENMEDPMPRSMPLTMPQQAQKELHFYVTLEPCNHFGKTPCTERINEGARAW